MHHKHYGCEAKHGLCNCAPSKIDDYGKYAWENAFAVIYGIPQLPDKLFDLISNKTPLIKPQSPIATEQPARASATKLHEATVVDEQWRRFICEQDSGKICAICDPAIFRNQKD